MPRLLQSPRAREQNHSSLDQGAKETSRPFAELVVELETLIETGDREKSERQLRQLRGQYSVPTIERLPKEIWETETDLLVLKTHSALGIKVAVLNAEATGRKLTEEEIKYLELLATHWCGWSPTSADHREDSWVSYLRYAYPSLADLQPVLDSLIWANEISRYPTGHVPRPPWLFLLATRERYFIYNFQEVAMMDAGDTLMEVFEGMKKGRWMEDMWESVPRRGRKEPCDYFPVYDDVPHTTEDHPLECPIKDFIV
jgi:hypothetical protein